MPGVFRSFGLSVVSVFACLIALNANAAAGRDGYANVRAVGFVDPGVARMPTMPTLPVMTVGNITQNISTDVAVPSVPNTPDVPDEPQVPDIPSSTPGCPDGGVKDSAYTIEMCMNDVLQCVNFGALPNGLNDMFDENTRNAIVNGMGLCVPQVDKCIATVRRDCSNIYRAASDVWIDFNSRRVQPEYYNFVLRKTGLTPNQAEAVCGMLDKNVSGSSFNRNNGQGLGGASGRFARWDAKTATCYVRVAAYNKDNHISNTWLFGAAGDDQPAEVWKMTGDTFTCNKDLFGFSLMNNTHTAAVVGIGGGTLVGAGVGAIVGHGARDFDCSRVENRQKLAQELRQAGQTRILNQFLEPEYQLSLSADLTVAQCNAILDLYDKYQEIIVAINECDGYTISEDEVIIGIELSDTITRNVEISVRDGKPVLDNAQITKIQHMLDCGDSCPKDLLVEKIQAALDAQAGGKCRFKPINLAKVQGNSIYCGAQTGCLYHNELAREVQPLADVLDGLEILKGEKSNMAKSIGIGAAVGAGAGSLATAITAYVEKNNINCRVGDNLEQVALGKSHVIGTLRDFYVKWNLNLPDVIAPTATIDSCEAWKYNCSRFTDLSECENAQFNYKPVDAPTFTLVRSVCKASGGMCIENYPVAKSQGACK